MARSRSRSRSRTRSRPRHSNKKSRKSKRQSKKSQKGGKRKLNAWQLLVKKTYRAGKSHNKNYKFSNALMDAKKAYKR